DSVDIVAFDRARLQVAGQPVRGWAAGPPGRGQDLLGGQEQPAGIGRVDPQLVQGSLVSAEPAEVALARRTLDRSRRRFAVGHGGWADDPFEAVAEDLFCDAVAVGMGGPEGPGD